MKTNIMRLLGLFAFLTVVSACEGQSTGSGSSESQLMQGRDKFVTDLKGCTDKHGYSPLRVAGVSELQLAPNELEWRNCAYAAVRAYEPNNPSLSKLYEQLVTEDANMTKAIQQGTMTRSQRRARTQQLLDQIHTAEQGQVAAATQAQERQNEEVRQVASQLNVFN